MNVVPKEFVRVKPEPLRGFIKALFRKVEMTEDGAGLMAELLVATDLRGVFSHGTRQAPTYLGYMKRKELNPRPQVKVVQESPATAVLDGDGGMGHLAAWKAAHLAVEKARAIGLGAAATRNHHHFGGAGKYSRVASSAGLAGFVVSSHLRRFSEGAPLMAAGGASPMSFAIPSGEEAPLVLDMATSFHLRQRGAFESMFEEVPEAFFKSLGLGAVCHALGGLMAGIETVVEGDPAWPAVNQGSFILAVDLARFADPATFRRQMDAFVRQVRALKPFPGHDRALLPGALEWERERQWAVEGIPIGTEHRAKLEEAGVEFGVEAPF